MTFDVAWCYSVEEGVAAFPHPEKVHLEKDPSPEKRGHLSCPAVRAVAVGHLLVRSPFSLRLRFNRSDDHVTITPVYPDTSIGQNRLGELLRLEPSNIWRSKDVPVIQFPSPYIFISDEFIEVEQCHPFLSESTKLNWRLIPGRFNIHGWHRPLNWAIEWDATAGDLLIKQGEPLYYLKFYDIEGRRIDNPNIKHIPMSSDIKRSLNSTIGVSGIQRGTAKLIHDASKNRTGNLIPKSS